MIRVYYDGKCGVCRREMAHYSSSASAGSFEWIDITVTPTPILPLGVTPDEALKVLHVMDDTGLVYKGFDAFCLIWKNIPQFNWLYSLTRIWGVCFVGRLTYAVFAWLRFHWMGYDRCVLPLKNSKRGGG